MTKDLKDMKKEKLKPVISYPSKKVFDIITKLAENLNLSLGKTAVVLIIDGLKARGLYSDVEG